MKLGASRAVRQAKDVRPVSSASRYGFRILAESTRLPTPCCEVRFGHSDRHMPRKQRQYSLLCSHNLTDSFCRKYFPLISIQIAGWCGPLDERNLLPQAQPRLFHAFAHSFARRKNSTILFSFCCALLRENTRGVGTPPYRRPKTTTTGGYQPAVRDSNAAESSAIYGLSYFISTASEPSLKSGVSGTARALIEAWLLLRGAL